MIESLRRWKIGGRRLEDYARVRRAIGRLRRNDPAQFDALEARGSRILNLGCGGNPVPGHFNVDFEWLPGVDACWDLGRPLPIADASVDGVFTEHCLEHLPREGAARLLVQCRRILRPGRALRIVVPDAELYARLYADWRAGSDVRLPYAAAGSRESGFTPLMALNRVFRDHGHLYAYDYELLRDMLAAAGFAQVSKARFREGIAAYLLADSPDRAPESLYVEAVAPV